MGDYNRMLLRIQGSDNKEVKDGYYDISIKYFDVFEYGWNFLISRFLEDIYDKCRFKYDDLNKLYGDKIEYFTLEEYIDDLKKEVDHRNKKMMEKNINVYEKFKDKNDEFYVKNVWGLTIYSKYYYFSNGILVDVNYNNKIIYIARFESNDLIIPIPPVEYALSNSFIICSDLKISNFNVSIDYTRFTDGVEYISFKDLEGNLVDLSKINIIDCGKHSFNKHIVNCFNYSDLDSDYIDLYGGETELCEIRDGCIFNSEEVKNRILNDGGEKNLCEFYRDLGFYFVKYNNTKK